MTACRGKWPPQAFLSDNLRPRCFHQGQLEAQLCGAAVCPRRFAASAHTGAAALAPTQPAARAAAGKPRGYAFIEYESKADMKTAYKMADGKKIDGRRVTVDVERGRTVPNWCEPGPTSSRFPCLDSCPCLSWCQSLFGSCMPRRVEACSARKRQRRSTCAVLLSNHPTGSRTNSTLKGPSRGLRRRPRRFGGGKGGDSRVAKLSKAARAAAAVLPPGAAPPAALLPPPAARPPPPAAAPREPERERESYRKDSERGREEPARERGRAARDAEREKVRQHIG